MAQTEKLIFQNVAYRPIVYRTGTEDILFQLVKKGCLQLPLHWHYNNTDCGVFKGYKIRNIFGEKSTIIKWNYQILIIGVMVSCQKLGIILENKVI